MYSGKMAFAIKVNGKILREQAETVFLPFGSEYSLLIKNLNSRRALVRIWIDGQEVVHDGLVVNANASVDLERFVKAGQLTAGQRFKFIERTDKVEQHRGVGLEDGLVRIEFEFERAVTLTTTYWNQPTLYGGGMVQGSTSGTLAGSAVGLGDYTLYNLTATAGSVTSAAAAPDYSRTLRSKSATSSAFVSQAAPSTTNQTAVPKNDAGITVGGSISEQKFSTTYFIGDGEKHVMVLRMLGAVSEQKVEAPVTVKSKQKCPTCGHVNKAKAKFCTECGTGIEMWPGARATHSRFQIGDWVICKGYKHRVKSARFTEDKVIYGLAFHSNLDGDIIEYPSEDVYGLRDFEKDAIDKMGVN